MHYTYSHPQLNILASIDLHARIQQTNLSKVFSVDHKGAANHGRSSGEQREKHKSSHTK